MQATEGQGKEMRGSGEFRIIARCFWCIQKRDGVLDRGGVGSNEDFVGEKLNRERQLHDRGKLVMRMNIPCRHREGCDSQG